MLLPWSYIGVIIGVFWMLIATKRASLKTIVMFFLFSGMDCIGYVLVNGHLFDSMQHLDQWANITGVPNGHIANYQSMGTAIRWSIQHYIPAWIVTPLLYHMVHKKNYKIVIFLLALLLFWSPMVALGAIPFAVGILIYEKFNFRKFISIPNILSLFCVVVPMGMYYLSMSLNTVGGSSTGLRGIEWLIKNWQIFILFVMLEFGIVWLAIWKGKTVNGKVDKLLLIISLITLVGILFFDYGTCHDFSYASICNTLVYNFHLCSCCSRRSTRKVENSFNYKFIFWCNF